MTEMSKLKTEKIFESASKVLPITCSEASVPDAGVTIGSPCFDFFYIMC